MPWTGFDLGLLSHKNTIPGSCTLYHKRRRFVFYNDMRHFVFYRGGDVSFFTVTHWSHTHCRFILPNALVA